MSFDPNLFTQSSVEGASATTYEPIPEGEYPGVVKDVAARALGEDRAVMDVTWIVDDEAVAEQMGMAEPTVRQSVWLDLDDAGNLMMSKGKNIGLGRLRTALDQNVDGQPWNPNMMIGQPATILITQRVVDTDKETGEPLPEADVRIYNDVKGVMAR